MIREDVVYALILDEAEERVLMVKNAGSVWTLPGGAVEKGETLQQAVIREVKEETNLTVEARELVAVNEAIFSEKGVHPIFFTFMAELIRGEPSITDKLEIEDIQWMDFKEAGAFMPYHSRGVKELIKGSLRYTLQGKL